MDLEVCKVIMVSVNDKIGNMYIFKVNEMVVLVSFKLIF